MSYTTLSKMKKSPGLIERIVACAAMEGVQADNGVGVSSGQPEVWVQQNLWELINGSDWVSAWEYAEDTKTVNVNPDTGAREDVINDNMILSSVQARKTELSA